ncbi:MAG: DNA polymerase III subunit beta [Cytophagales bacterium]|nr:DNA polymerase III subunit beta [Cytophagales bacterium]
MKFVVSSSALQKQLSNINGVIASSPIVPILDNFLFEVSANTLTITASDLQTSVVTKMEIESDESGSIAIPAKILLDTLKNLPEQPITFLIDLNTYNIELESENGQYKLSGENATDFPQVPSVPDTENLEIPASVLSTAISNTIFAVSTDELRLAMTGIYIDANSSSTTFVATDGHRLVRVRRTDITAESTNNVIIPRKALNLLKSSLPSDESEVSVSLTDSNAFFTYGNSLMVCRLIDERYPDYENVIPTNNPKHLLIDRTELLRSLKRISIYASKSTHQVRLGISENKLEVSAEDQDFGNGANETLVCEYSGEAMDIGFNAKFLLEMLNNLTSTSVRLELSEPNRAGILIPVSDNESEDILMLVMPVMLNTHS